MKNNMNKYKAAQTAIKVLPFAALVLLFGIFLAVVSAKGYRLEIGRASCRERVYVLV